MPSDGPMLEVSEMAFSYSDEGTLKNIDFEIMPGEFVALMGPNGSGKTTMMRCINISISLPVGRLRSTRRT